MISDFSVYFDIKYFSFAKINPYEISKPLHLRELVQAKILYCKCRVCSTDNFLSSLFSQYL